MASTSAADQYHNWSIYVILSLRGAEPDFHWGIFLPTDTPKGTVWHAVNRSGGWSLERKTSNGVPTSMSLALAFKVGTVNAQNLSTFEETLNAVPVNTGGEFNCVVWVKNALLALHMARIIVLLKSIEEIEEWAEAMAESMRSFIESGTSSALVLNEHGYSTAA